jgi:outer membrane biosynthesis protein TonB
MKVVLRNDEYTIYQRRDGRYAVEGADKKAINGDEKVAILVANDLIKAALPAAPEPEPVEEVAEEAAAEAPAEERQQKKLRQKKLRQKKLQQKKLRQKKQKPQRKMPATRKTREAPCLSRPPK